MPLPTPALNKKWKEKNIAKIFKKSWLHWLHWMYLLSKLVYGVLKLVNVHKKPSKRVQATSLIKFLHQKRNQYKTTCFLMKVTRFQMNEDRLKLNDFRVWNLCLGKDISQLKIQQGNRFKTPFLRLVFSYLVTYQGPWRSLGVIWSTINCHLLRA